MADFPSVSAFSTINFFVYYNGTADACAVGKADKIIKIFAGTIDSLALCGGIYGSE